MFMLKYIVAHFGDKIGVKIGKIDGIDPSTLQPFESS
jgi:hypothetical protein